WTLNFFVNRAVFGMNLQEAIDAPNWHTAHFPSSFYPRESVPGRVVIEDRGGEPVIDELKRRGHDVVEAGPWALGRVTAAELGADGWLKAGANPRAVEDYAGRRASGPPHMH